MKVKFDDPTIRNLQPASTPYDCMADKEPGFGLRIHPTGTMTFFYQYKVDGQRRFMALGNYPTTKLKKARELYQAELEKVKALRRGSADGVDPVQEVKRQKQERLDTKRLRIEEEQKEMAALTVEKLVTGYIEKYAKRFKRSWAKDEQMLNREVVATWGKRKAADIVKRDVIKLLEQIVDRGAPIMANNTFAVIRKMFNWAIEQDMLQNSPCIGVKPPSPKVSRERVLSEAEIRSLWVNIDRTDLSISNEARSCLKLILLTAQRPGEVIGLHTSEIDGNWWTIPAERAKNGKAHRVYLSPLAQEIISDSIAAAKKSKEKADVKNSQENGQDKKTTVELSDQKYSGFVFPTPHKTKEKPIGDTALAVAVGRNLAYPLTDDTGKPLLDKANKPVKENRLGVEQFTPHDLRRTAATFMAGMGYMDEIIDAVLNHVKQGIIRTYNRHDYDKEKQQALEAWERKLNGIITGTVSNVVPIKRKTA